MNFITSAISTLIALAGTLRAQQTFLVFDHGLTDIKAAWEHIALLQELGYDDICTRPQIAYEEFPTAMDRHGIKINPCFPASGPSHWLFQGPPAESKLLAAAIFRCLPRPAGHTGQIRSTRTPR